MGGGNSTSNTTKNINSIVTNLTINSVQKVSTQINQEQLLNIDCTQFQEIKAKFLSDCRKDMLSLLEKGKITSDEMQKYCTDPFGSCGAKGVKVSGILQANLSSEQISQIQTEIENSLTVDIENEAKQKNGIFEFSNTTKNTVYNETNAISNIIKNFLQEDLTEIKGKQTIAVKDGYVDTINQELFSNTLTKRLQSNVEYTKAVSNIAAAIRSQASQDSGMSGDLFRNIMIIIAVIVIIMICLGVLLWFLKKTRNSDKKASVIIQNKPSTA